MRFDKLEVKKYTIGEDVKIDFIESGNIYDIYSGITRIKQLHSNNFETSYANIFARIEKDGKVIVKNLIGVNSNSKFDVIDNKAYYKGVVEGIDYTVVISAVQKTYFIEVKFGKSENTKLNVFYGMDFAVADKYAVRNNEAYVCQYVDHQAFKTENGYVVCSRQNQGKNCYLEQGSLTNNIAFSTDGFQFFGKEYKVTNKIKALEENTLSNEVYQYEFAYCALQSENVSLDQEQEFVFYGSFLDSIDGVVSNPILTEEVVKLYEEIKTTNFCYELTKQVELNFSFDDVYNSREITKEELDKFYPNRCLEEVVDNNLYSFFLDNHAHVVLPKKELVLERPTGNLLISGNHFDFEEVLSSTVYMFGVFNSQVVCGNTSFNKLSSNIRNSLNVQRLTGHRLFVKIDGKFQLLNIPLIFENGVNYARWIYAVEDDYLEVKTYVSASDSKIKMDVKSLNGVKYEFICTNNITMSQNEHEALFNVCHEGNTITFTPSKESMMSRYENISFKMLVNKEFGIHNDSIFTKNGESLDENLLCFTLNESEFSVTIVGDTFGKGKDFAINDFETECELYLKDFSQLLNDFELSINNSEKENIESLNHLAYWYTHDALVHYTSPHGLEQYNGAAWGTRDVCQGPAEYFLATLNYKMVKKIILEVFSHQFIENGNWPQWFMFDRFYNIQQHESHGDIIVWPGRLLGLYLNSTHDYSILEEKIPYMSMATNDYTKETYTVLEHLENEIKNIEKDFIPNTYLSSYGGGDWDDTLQPANKAYADNMVSGWTVALTYEMFMLLHTGLNDKYAEYKNKYLELANNIKKDYNKYIYVDNVPAGFILFENDTTKEIIHPRDNNTNMKYRLLPMNRGIIGELFDEEQKDLALTTIRENLLYPDGVRLMDKTVPYKGGLNTYFQRAETASNFGREISLQYCHAHIRYCEALAKVGDSNLYHNLMIINPVKMHDFVGNAMPRQRHSYFSSSDGNFKTRYEAMKHFNDLKTGKVQVKNGWRVYSSGPGIYLYQVIKNLLGVKTVGHDLLIDPNLNESLSGLTFNFRVFGKLVNFEYIKNSTNELVVEVDGVKVETTDLENKYKRSSKIVNYNNIKENSKIKVYF